MRKNKKRFFAILFIILSVFSFIHSFIIVFPVESKFDNKKIGVIDGNLSQNYEKIEINQQKIATNRGHGDLIVQFIKTYGYDGEIFYYSAANEDGKIYSESIINGLEWMKQNNITIVNISLSSLYYNADLERWLKDNPSIQVFASYNNLANSFDYPAMYDNVIGSGKKDPITYKAIDKKYRSHRIFLINKNGIHSFKGNSFLSIITTLKYLD